ncbi:hypothetical protein DFQ26_007006, partial [Actinomortierella ambigua]
MIPSTTDTHPQDGAQRRGSRSPEEDASFISRLTFWWIRPLFKIGYRRQLQEQDVFDVLDRYRAEVVSKELADAWQAEVQHAEGPQPRPRPRLLVVLARLLWTPYLKSGAFVELQDTCAILTPILIQKILQFIQQSQAAARDGLDPPRPSWYGYVLVLLMLVLTMLQAMAAQGWVNHALKVSIPARTALIDLMFQKATRLSPKARQQNRFTDGKVVNLLTNDTFRLELVPFYLWLMVSIPIFLTVIMGFLIHMMGPGPALLGGAVLFVATPAQGWATAWLAPWRKRLSAIADRRVEWTNQILRAIQVIKLFAWEPSFLRRVTELRGQEVVIVRRLLLARGMIGTTSSMVPVLASAASFVLYAAMGHKLDATIIFPALAFYNSMRSQMVIWPVGFSIITDARVSAKRIEEFLMAEEIQPLPEPDPTCSWAIEIRNGFFYWDRLEDNEAIGGGEEDKNTTRSEKPHAKDKISGQLMENQHGQATPQEADPPTSEANPADSEDIVQLDESLATTAATDVAADPTRNIFLRDIQLQIPRGALVAVIGAVGQGKSSLLQAMVGNMPMQSGRLVRGAATTFAAQQPWIQNATIRENILFGLPYDAVRYNRIIRACQLERDLANLPRGDLTELGERGINLSGGQKARVSLARAVYFQVENADTTSIVAATTVIMDDPLAAVDAHVGRRLWNDCILTELQGRTRIVATHQLHVLPDVDLIVCMKDGRIDQIGSYQELMEDPDHDGFRTLVDEFGGVTTGATADAASARDTPDLKGGQHGDKDIRVYEDIASFEESSGSKEVPIEESEKEVDCDQNHATKNDGNNASSTARSAVVNSDDSKRDLATAGKQIVKEERKYGAITLQSYLQFFHAVGWTFWCGVFGAYLLQQAVAVMMNLWLSYWTSDKFKLTHWEYIGIYIGLVLGQLVFVYLASAMLAFAVAKTGEVLHRDALVSVLRARMAFFETTPLGRILTRFSKDVDSLDNTLHSSMNDYFIALYGLLGILVLLIIVIPWMALALVPLGGLYYFVSVYSRATTRELKRLDSVKRADTVSFLSASLAGIETMRTFEGSMARCIAQSRVKQDASNSPNFAMQYSTRWGALNGILIGVSTTFIANLIIMISRYSMDASQAGLILSYLVQLGTLLNWVLQRYANMEMAMNSAERLDDYIYTLDHEEKEEKEEKEDSLAQSHLAAADSSVAPVKESHRVDPEWPQYGHIRFTNVWMRYRPELP